MNKQPHPVSIFAEGLSKRFNSEWIFRNFSYEFKSGNIYAVTGPNGSGKSTLLSVLWGQVPQTAGTLDYQLDRTSIAADEIFRHVAIAAPYMELIEDLTLMECLQFHFKLKKVRNNLTYQEILDKLYLTGNRDKFIRNFSSGMKQRVKLGLAMFTDAPVVFLDEPGSHLDQAAFQWYRSQLASLPTDTIIFIGSNDQAEYENANEIIDLRAYKK
ncbi:MAG TPA: ABC transporter ATP-binding protein [Chryseosolibacter sp.]